MDKAATVEKINGFLMEEFEVEQGKITPESNLRETLELDSLDYIDLVVVIENNFGFKVKAEDFAAIVTFQNFYEYVIGRLEGKAAS